MWEAGKEAGFIALLKHENKTTLASLYFRIKCHNYEAEKARDVSILKKIWNDKLTLAVLLMFILISLSTKDP